MTKEEFDSRRFIYHLYQPNDIPKDFPTPDKVFVLKDVFHGRGGPFQRLLDCAGIRYVLLVEFNKHDDVCFENSLLQKMYQGFEEEDITCCRKTLSLVSEQFMAFFWPYLVKDIQTRRENGTLMRPIGPLDYDRRETHKLQLKTINGSIHATEHDIHLDNRSEPFGNPYSDLRCFQKSQIEALETITMRVFKVRIHGEQYALKAGCSDIMRSIEKLRRSPGHQNVLSLSGVLVDEKGRIMGMLTPFVSGKALWLISSATRSQKEKWKAKISEAMNFLHENDIVWGDAKADNILISSATDEPLLIDFEGGQSEGWVDEHLRDTLEGDLQALPRILKYVDEILTSEGPE